MGLSVRTRFEVFKRDGFVCQYCGRKSPDVVLEVDHIVPACNGGSDDVINLTTSCWECNRGKGGVPLAEVMTGVAACVRNWRYEQTAAKDVRGDIDDYNG